MKEKERQKLYNSITNISDKYIEEAQVQKAKQHSASRGWVKWGIAAACFALVAIIGAGVFKSGFFEAKIDNITLDSGETISFVKSDLIQSQIDLNASIRELTTDEIKMLFGDLPVTAHAYFDAENHNIVGLEGKFDDMKLIVSASGVNLLDTVIVGSEYKSTIDNISINAGYFVTGQQNTVIYYAAFGIGDDTIYIQNSGAKDNSEAVKTELADAIQQLITNGDFDLSQIHE